MPSPPGQKVDSPSFYAGSAGVAKERRGVRDRSLESSPTEIYRQGYSVSRVVFQNLSDDAIIEGKPRNVNITERVEEATELQALSKISLYQDATLPMALDNDRFFSADEGYEEILTGICKRMESVKYQSECWGEPDAEMGFFGWLWRSFVILFMSWTYDAINQLMYTRGVQVFLPFQTCYESFALGGVIGYFDVDTRKRDISKLERAFKNRNASRILVQTLSRWDYIWHLHTQITWSRFFDGFGQLPFLGFLGFPATENFPSTKNHALQAIFRNFFTGSWLTRFLTGKAQGIVAYDPYTAAQNLAAEVTGFETANRNQYGTYFGRQKTNAFRFEHSLPTDESVVRTFMTSPESTMLNNGVEHVLRCMANHWRNMLYQANGNFAHQRMEQLNPLETLRFHMPIVLHVLANLRGRNAWDVTTLGPFIKKLQYINPDKVRRRNAGDVESASPADSEIDGPCHGAKRLITEMKNEIVKNVCGGVPSRTEPLNRWLDNIYDAVTEINREAQALKEFTEKVDIGIRIGYNLLKLVDWYVPKEKILQKAIIDLILKKNQDNHGILVECIHSALDKLTSMDARTLKELVARDLMHIEAAQLLLGRVSTLLHRELRRHSLDERIQELSRGDKISADHLESQKWYWVVKENKWNLYVFRGRHLASQRLKFLHTELNMETLFDGNSVSIYKYVPVAEAISRAQKAFMTIELDFGKKFSYNAFMEFGSTDRSSSLHVRLRRLLIVSQMHCGELDKARLNVLAEVKNSAQRSRFRPATPCMPQNVTFLGGGPTGLLAAIHCVQNVLLSGGEVKIYEGRDAYDQEGSSFERAQIVRLDPRQIAMLRYHLGTGYEDVYVPCRGETDAHMGNSLPIQGFVEVTIKRLESMLLDEIVNMRSKDLLQFYGDSKIVCNVSSGSFTKKGKNLKIGDRFFDDRGRLLTVEGFVHNKRVKVNELKVGDDYDIVLPRDKKVRQFRLVEVDHQYDWYTFESHDSPVQNVTGSKVDLPPIFRAGQGRIDPSAITVSVVGETGQNIWFDEIANRYVQLDFSNSHVILAHGKPSGSRLHFSFTTEEPYAVCCIEGLKISMGMHSFGEKRWGSGLLDDIRSHTDQNTRIVGDFTKSVVLMPIALRMQRKVKEEAVWIHHFEQLALSANDRVGPLVVELVSELEKFCHVSFRRERLQTRFFELGNNFYLGMELPREYDSWKKHLVQKIAPSKPDAAPTSAKETRKSFQRILLNQIDRLWYESTLEIIAEGDVYNPGGRAKIPHLFTINSPFEQRLGELKELEAFRFINKSYVLSKHDGNGQSYIKVEHEQAKFPIPTQTYVRVVATDVKKYLGELSQGEIFRPVDIFEIMRKGIRSSIVRNSGGFVCELPHTVSVGRASDLARAPDGYSESNVALASFPVTHVVSHRTFQINLDRSRGDDESEYITAFVGDAQASPHFMRYSGLTGACINCMSFNNLIAQAIQGVSFEERIQRYAFETTWSNGEVVQRGTGNNYGDGFLRPGFPYRQLIDYLFQRALEHWEMHADTRNILSRDWKIKIAAALVPRGLETQTQFIDSLLQKLEHTVKEKFEYEVKSASRETQLSSEIKKAISDELDRIKKEWAQNIVPPLANHTNSIISQVGCLIESVMIALFQTLDYAVQLRLDNLRVSSQLFHQPKPVDSIVDDFAVEAQNFANSFTQATALAAATVALQLYGNRFAYIGSFLLNLWNIAVSFGTITNVSRYKNRNEEARIMFVEDKLSSVMKSVFLPMTRDQRDQYTFENNPFLSELEGLAQGFVKYAHYYDIADEKVRSFEGAFKEFKTSHQDRMKPIHFARRLVEEFIPDTFHVNSYLQENLVRIYKAVIEMLTISKHAPAEGVGGADKVYRMLLNIKPELEASLQRGPIAFGFLRRQKAWYQTALPVTIRYLCGPFLPCNKTLTRKIWTIVQYMESMQGQGTSEKTSRAVRDLTEFYHATRESAVGSMMILSGSIVFAFSVVFSFFQLISFSQDCVDNAQDWVCVVVDYVAVTSIGSMLGAFLAIFHFVRKLRHLFALDRNLGKGNNSDKRINHARKVTKIQQFLVGVRLIAVIVAAVALPWSIRIALAENGNDEQMIPSILASFSVAAAIFAAVMFFFVEFKVRYNLDPCLGLSVCEPFRDRIEQIRKNFTNADAVPIDTPQELEREDWEYAAREFLHQYRFDTVFAADRFGSILQHLQSGNKRDQE